MFVSHTKDETDLQPISEGLTDLQPISEGLEMTALHPASGIVTFNKVICVLKIYFN